MTHLELVKECKRLKEFPNLVKIIFCDFFNIDKKIRDSLLFEVVDSSEIYYVVYNLIIKCKISSPYRYVIEKVDIIFKELGNNLTNNCIQNKCASNKGMIYKNSKSDPIISILIRL